MGYLIKQECKGAFHTTTQLWRMWTSALPVIKKYIGWT